MRKKDKIWNSESIKALRVKYLLSQDLLSRIIGTRQQTVSEWEKSIYLPGNAYVMVLDNTEDYLEKWFEAHKQDYIKFHAYLCRKYGGTIPGRHQKLRGVKHEIPAQQD